MKDEKIDVKIVSKEEAFWTQIQEKTKAELESLNKMVKFNQAILEMVNKKVSVERRDK